MWCLRCRWDPEEDGTLVELARWIKICKWWRRPEREREWRAVTSQRMLFCDFFYKIVCSPCWITNCHIFICEVSLFCNSIWNIVRARKVGMHESIMNDLVILRGKGFPCSQTIVSSSRSEGASQVWQQGALATQVG